jgi:hypothetical protein
MVAYATYADRLGWTPRQVDELTLEEDEWLMPVIQAMDAQRSYNQQKAQESAERAAKSKQGKGLQ